VFYDWICYEKAPNPTSNGRGFRQQRHAWLARNGALITANIAITPLQVNLIARFTTFNK
jgi:hypothetical protein